MPQISTKGCRSRREGEIVGITLSGLAARSASAEREIRKKCRREEIGRGLLFFADQSVFQAIDHSSEVKLNQYRAEAVEIFKDGSSGKLVHTCGAAVSRGDSNLRSNR